MTGPQLAVQTGNGWAVIEDNGSRTYMEDRFCAGERVMGDTALLFGVFDGHNGSEVAEYCRTHAASVLHRRLVVMQPDGQSLPETLADAVHDLDREAGLVFGSTCDIGSTACMVVLTPEDAWFLNVGDSRAILKTGREVRQVSLDHKPTLRSEADRIRRHGGFLSNRDGSWRVNGRLNLSRSIGDWAMRPFIIPSPTIEYHHRTGAQEYVVLASDGLFDVMSNVDVARAIDGQPHTRQGLANALRSLVIQSRARGSLDNITVLYIGLKRAVNSMGARASRARRTAAEFLGL